MADHNLLGQWGEQAAADYLTAHGYAIAGRNVRIGSIEIDIIAMKGDGIMFVEVKTRSTNFTDPVSAVGDQKIRRLCRAANSYIQGLQIPHRPQFDVIAVVGSPQKFEIVHYPDAFMPPLAIR